MKKFGALIAPKRSHVNEEAKKKKFVSNSKKKAWPIKSKPDVCYQDNSLSEPSFKIGFRVANLKIRKTSFNDRHL